MSDWFYTKNDQRHGPITAEELKQLPARGELQPTDMVWKDGMAEWVPARRISGLFPNASPAKASLPPQAPRIVQASPPPVPPRAKASPPPMPSADAGRPAPSSADATPEPSLSSDFETPGQLTEPWYYRSGGKKYGPVSIEQLTALAAAGKLNPTDIVMQGGSKAWVVALTIDGLFPKSAAVPAEPEAASNPLAPAIKSAANAMAPAIKSVASGMMSGSVAAISANRRWREALAKAPGLKSAVIAMFIVAGAALLLALAGIGEMLSGDVHSVVGVCIALMFVQNCGVVISAIQMLRLKNYKAAYAGCFLVMGSWLWLIFTNFPFGLILIGLLGGTATGIWSLSVLRKPEVKAAFGECLRCPKCDCVLDPKRENARFCSKCGLVLDQQSGLASETSVSG